MTHSGYTRWFCLLLGSVLFVIGVTCWFAWRFVKTQIGILAGFVVAGIGGGCLAAGVGLVNHSRRLKTKSTVYENNEADASFTGDARSDLSEIEKRLNPGEFVLYLRSFAVDSITSETPGSFSFFTVEENITEVLKEVGPVEAIGQPGDHLPELGARRWYLKTEEWQKVVANLMHQARLVVFYVGPSDGAGLRWEVRTALRNLPPKRFVFFVSSINYEVFQEHIKPHVAIGARPHQKMRWLRPPPLYLVHFNSDLSCPRIDEIGKKPTLFSIYQGIQKPLAPSIKFSMKPVFEQLDVPWNRPPITVYGTFSALILLAFLLGLAILLRVWLR